MLIFGDELKPLIIDDADDPIVSDYIWVLDVEERDFMFSNIVFLDDHYEKCKGFDFNGQYVELPESWFVLIMDTVSGEMDLIMVKDIKGRHFDAFVYSHSSVLPRSAKMIMKNARVFKKFCYPIMNKNIMLIHPIDEDHGIVITPHDITKKIKDLNVLDFYE